MRNRILLVKEKHTETWPAGFELQRYGLIVETTSSSGGIVASSRQRPPRAIVFDADLPEKDAYHLCCALKADPGTAHIPVIILTFADEIDAALAAFEAGASNYIPRDVFTEYNLVESLRHLNVL